MNTFTTEMWLEGVPGEVLALLTDPEAIARWAPVIIDASYTLCPAQGGSRVRAAVNVQGKGLLGGLLARATEAILSAGALKTSLGRLARELERGAELVPA